MSDDTQESGPQHVQVIAQFPMKEGQELRDFMHAALQLARENLERDGVLLPAAFIIRDRVVVLIQVTFRTAEQKRAAYGELIEIAQGIAAEAIVTLNDAYVSAGDPESYYPGKLAAEGADEAIVLTLSGPALPTWSITQPYSRKQDGKFEFGELREDRGTEAGLLQGWASEELKTN